MPLSQITKINLAWTAIVLSGFGSFILIRNSVIQQRTDNLKLRRQFVQDIERETALSDPPPSPSSSASTSPSARSD